MRNLETLELRGVIDMILGQRLAALLKVTHGAAFEKTLRRLSAAFAALPEAILKLPLVDVLAALDEEHDDWGTAIDLLVKAIEEGPKALQSLAPIAALVRERYMAKRSEVLSSYAVEDKRGQDRLASLPTDAATLDQVPTPDKRTLRAWIEDYATAGTRLGGTLDERAAEIGGRTPHPGFAEYARLRGEAISTVRKIRSQIDLDLDANPELPRTLAADVLGQLDEVVRLADARAASNRKKKPMEPVG